MGEGACSIQNSWSTLGHSTIYLIIITLFISFLRTLLLTLFVLVCLRKGSYRVSEGGVNTGGQLGRLKRPPTLFQPPLNLVIYMHLRIFAYTSNVLITSFEYMELILTSGTLKNFRFLLRSCLSTDRAPVIKLNCSTWQD